MVLLATCSVKSSALPRKLNTRKNTQCHSFITIPRNNRRRAEWKSRSIGNNIADVANEVVLSSQGLDATAAADVDSTISKIIDFVIQFGEFYKKGLKVAGDAATTVKSGVEVITPVFKKTVDMTVPVVKGAYDAILPVVVSGTDKISEVTSSSVSPIVKSGSEEIKSFLTDKGFDVESIKSSTTAVAKAVPSAVQALFDLFTKTDPSTLGYYALFAVAIYYLGPVTLKKFLDSLKGYSGDVTPASALNLLETKGNVFLIDMRTQYEKETGGVPNLPKSVDYKNIELEFAVTVDKKQRNQLKSPEAVECKITALKIAALKRVSKSTSLFLMDKNGNVSSRVAKELNNLGFGRCYVIEGGYSGWIKSNLQIKPSKSIYRAEVITPVFGTTKQYKTLSKVTPKSSTINISRQLPPPK